MMRRQKAANFKPVNYDLSPFMPQNTNLNKSISFENEPIETIREKLQIKSEALNLLGKQLELCNKEKAEYKRLIDTLYDKNLLLKKSLYFKENQIDAEDENFFNTNIGENSVMPHKLNETRKQLKINKSNHSNISPNNSTNCLFNDIDSEDYVKILKDLIKLLQKEKFELIQKYEDTQQQLNDSRSDLRLLREQIVRQRVGSYNEGLTTTIKLDLDDSNPFMPFKLNLVNTPLTQNSHEKQPISTSISTSNLSSLAANNIKENLIKEIELLREQKTIIENDLKLVLCQKEEIEIERDSFKIKYLKLNDFLLDSASHSLNENEPENIINEDNIKIFENKLKNLNKSQIRLSVDEMISQNKFLNESNRNLKEEIETLRSTIKKYKQSIQKESVSMVSRDSDSAKSINFPTESITSTLNKTEVKNLLKTVEKILDENRRNEFSQTSLIDSSLFELIADLKLVIESLLEGLNDKLIAHSHQRKVNKMLATRIQDLEKQISNYQSIESQLSFNINNNTPATPTERKANNFQIIKSVSPFSSNPMSAAESGLNLDVPLIPSLSFNVTSTTKHNEFIENIDQSLISFDNNNKSPNNES